MNKFVYIISFSVLLIFTGCSKSLSPELEKKVNLKLSKYKLRVTGEKKKLTPLSFAVSGKIDLTEKENKQFSKAVLEAKQFGSKIEFDVEKYNIELKYTVDSDSLIFTGEYAFKDEKTLKKALTQTIKRDTHKKECSEWWSPPTSYKKSCVKYRSVKLKNAGEIEKEIRASFAKAKSYKKGDVISISYTLGVVVQTSGKQSQTNIKMKKGKNKTL